MRPGNINTSLQHLRDLSCLLRCSLLEKARLQNWHLYFFSGSDDFRICDEEAVGSTFMAATGIWGVVSGWISMLVLSSPVLAQIDRGNRLARERGRRV